MAFVGGYDQTLHALDLLDKKVVWRKIANAEIAHAPVVGKVGGLDVVFWSASDRSVYACVAYSGRRFWTRELVPPSNSLGDSHLSSPLLLDGSLYVSAFVYDRSLPRNRQDGSLYCLDVLTGRIEWRIPVCPGILNSPVGFHVDGRAYVVVAARRGVVRCFDVSEGTPRLVWSFQMPHEVLGSPVVAELPSGPRLFLGSKYGNLIAIDGVTGAEVWQQMAGNWIDNTACVGNVAGKTAVFAGSHDYHLYAFDAETGDRMWRRTLGGEVFSAPCFLSDGAGRGHVAVAALDNHLYIVDADTGAVATSMFTGNPIWDKVAKGETTWGSPVAIEAGDGSVIVYGSYSDIVYVLPAFRACSLTAMARSTASLWWSLLVVLIVFTGVVLPITLGVRSEFGPESGLPISSEVGE
jgi:outer membrane protein assembly factor BamB